MTIYSMGPNCFKAYENVAGGNAVDVMIAGMRERGVTVRVTKNTGAIKEFCIS